MSRTSSGRVYATLNALGVRLPPPDGRELFHDLNLAFGDERTGLVGANGSGKSTLARIVAGVGGGVEPIRGSVVRRGRIGYLAQDASLGNATTVAAVLGLEATLDALRRLEHGAGTAEDLDIVDDHWDVRERASRALERVGLGGVSLERSLGEVSGGEATRLAMAALLVQDPDLLVLDEPTNHLDTEARSAIHLLAATWERGLLIVSHDRQLLEHVDRIVELSSLGALEYGGGYASYRAQRDLEEEAAARAADAAKRSVRLAARRVQLARERKEKSDARGRRARATGSQPKLVLNGKRERSQVSSQRLSMQGARILEHERERLRVARARVAMRATLDFTLPSTGVHENKRILEVESLSFWHASRNDARVRDFDLTLVGPEHLALVGSNGSGKTTLLHLLAGRLAPNEGRIDCGVARERVALLEQRTRWPLPEQTLLENFLAQNPERDASYARQALAAFLFTGDAPLKRVAALSGGETLRASLAMLLHRAEPPALLLLDEPTNHLDLDGTLAVERALAAYDGALIVVSHDEHFLNAIGIERRFTAPFTGSPEGVEVTEQPPQE